MSNLERIEKALDAIRPYFHADGGDVRVASLRDDMVLELELQGSCGSCPSSPMTLNAVEDAVRTAVPELKAVVTVNGLLN
jgi:Fe-S cluster biogenesis protein NfuA